MATQTTAHTFHRRGSIEALSCSPHYRQPTAAHKQKESPPKRGHILDNGNRSSTNSPQKQRLRAYTLPTSHPNSTKRQSILAERNPCLYETPRKPGSDFKTTVSDDPGTPTKTDAQNDPVPKKSASFSNTESDMTGLDEWQRADRHAVHQMATRLQKFHGELHAHEEELSHRELTLSRREDEFMEAASDLMAIFKEQASSLNARSPDTSAHMEALGALVNCCKKISSELETTAKSMASTASDNEGRASDSERPIPENTIHQIAVAIRAEMREIHATELAQLRQYYEFESHRAQSDLLRNNDNLVRKNTDLLKTIRNQRNENGLQEEMIKDLRHHLKWRNRDIRFFIDHVDPAGKHGDEVYTDEYYARILKQCELPCCDAVSKAPAKAQALKASATRKRLSARTKIRVQETHSALDGFPGPRDEADSQTLARDPEAGTQSSGEYAEDGGWGSASHCARQGQGGHAESDGWTDEPSPDSHTTVAYEGWNAPPSGNGGWDSDPEASKEDDGEPVSYGNGWDSDPESAKEVVTTEPNTWDRSWSPLL